MDILVKFQLNMEKIKGVYLCAILTKATWNCDNGLCIFLKLGKAFDSEFRLNNLKREYDAEAIIPILYCKRPEFSKLDCLELEKIIKSKIKSYQLNIRTDGKIKWKRENYSMDFNVINIIKNISKRNNFKIEYEESFLHKKRENYLNVIDDIIKNKYLIPNSYKILDNKRTYSISKEIERRIRNPGKNTKKRKRKVNNYDIEHIKKKRESSEDNFSEYQIDPKLEAEMPCESDEYCSFYPPS